MITTRAFGKRQGRLLRKYAIVFGALVGGTLVAGSLLQVYFYYQESQRELSRIEQVEASRAALQICQFVDTIRAQLVAILPASWRSANIELKLPRRFQLIDAPSPANGHDRADRVEVGRCAEVEITVKD